MNNSREAKIVRTSIVGIIANVILVAFKAFIGLLAHSVSMITDAINNLTDALGSITTIIGTKIASKDPDKKHPYGHGRAEYLTAIIIAALIFFAGGTAITESINSLINNEKPTYDVYAFIVIGVAIAVKIGLGIYFKIRGKKLNSQALKASGTDALLDSILSTGTLVAALVARFADVYIDGYIGIGIGLFIIKSGIDVIREAFSSLLGERIDSELTHKIKEDICSIPGVLGAYDLIINEYGPEKMIGSVHIEVNESTSAAKIQEMTTNAAALIYAKYKIALTIGIYVLNENDPIAMAIKGRVKELIKDNKNIFELHGFYIDYGTKLVKFDLVLSYDEKKPYDLINSISRTLKEEYPDYNYYINIDNDYSDVKENN